jgi:hypothetical protein
MTNLPIQRMVLYKHGVGFFERYGSSGDSHTVSLIFKKDEMNDILKSLAAFPQGDGQVVNVSYETPEEKQAALDKAPILLSDDAALLDLVRSLRGRLVCLHLAPPEVLLESSMAHGVDAPEAINGLVLGVDEVAAKPEHTLISVMLEGDQGTSESALRTFPLSQIRGVDILDTQSSDDLRYVLELSQARDEQRNVTIVLDRPQQDLLVSYVAPTPTWRVSYRLVYKADAATDLQENGGELLIQGWGIVDNQLDEDLEAVRLTLIAGQPISFVYDLYTPRFIERPTVEDEDRTVPGPISFDGVLEDAKFLADTFAAADMDLGGHPAPRSAAPRRDLGKATKVEVTGTAKGEFFQYEVGVPVTIKRGQSAMVPILNATLAARKQHLFNQHKLPDHPVVAILADNQTGLTLERGPATVLEDNNYVGEAVLSFTPVGNEFFVPYAVDLGIKVIPLEENCEVTTTIAMGKGDYLVHDYYRIITTTYAIENRNPTAINLVIEQNRRPGYEVFDTPATVAETIEFYRWQVSLSASAQTSFEVQERSQFSRQERITNLNYRTLRSYLKNQFIDESLFEQLKHILDLHQQVQTLEKTLKQQSTKLEQLSQQQKDAAEKMTPLGRDGDEGTLRRRLVAKIQQLEDERDQLTEAITSWQQDLQTLARQIEQQLQQLRPA